MKELLFMLCCVLLASAASAGGVKIGIESDHTLTFNGERFLPLGVAPGPTYDLKTPDGKNGWKELADGGINYFRTGPHGTVWDDAVEERVAKEIAAAEEAGGIGAWVFLRELSSIDGKDPQLEVRLRKVVNEYKNRPGVYFWKNVDEPGWGESPAEPMIKAYEIIKELDPNRPVICIHAPRNTIKELRRYNDACDISGADIYPVSIPMGKHSHLPNKGLSVVGDYTKRMIEVVNDQKPIFMVLGVSWSGAVPERGNILIRPTFKEQRYMIYQALICGAKGIHWFGFPLALSERDKPYEWNWTYWYGILKPLLSEFKKGTELNRVLIAPKNDLTLTVEGADDVEYLARKVGKKIYVLAAKREGPEASVKLSGLGVSGTADVMFEYRSVPVENGVITDTFEPNDVHIYRINSSGN